MALERTLLDVGLLSEQARRAVSGSMKLMAARGLAPLPDPVDLISVLYQLTLDADSKVGEAARKSAAELPEKVLHGALANPAVDPRVLDLFAELCRGSAVLMEQVILNTSVGDETIAVLAAVVGESEVDLIAQNEQRLVRFPEIISAMYGNTKARMSTVDRAVEYAVREGVKVPGIPAWNEIVSALMGRTSKGELVEVSDEEAAAADAMFSQAAEQAASDDPPRADAEDKEIKISEMTIPMKIRLASMGNKFQRSQLIRDSSKLVAMAVIKSPGMTEIEAAKYASNQALCDDVIQYIASRREWTKQYSIKLSLVMNPKTPITVAIRFLPFMRGGDLKAIARSKGIASAVTAAAKKRMIAKMGGTGKR